MDVAFDILLMVFAVSVTVLVLMMVGILIQALRENRA